MKNKRIFIKNNDDFRRRPKIAQKALISPIKTDDPEFNRIKLRCVKRTYCPHCKEEVHRKKRVVSQNPVQNAMGK